jgi:hypothetical protein
LELGVTNLVIVKNNGTNTLATCGIYKLGLRLRLRLRLRCNAECGHLHR